MSLMRLQPNFSFTKTALTEVYTTIVQPNLKSWDFSQVEAKDWPHAMDSRTRVMLRHVSQAAGKKKPPKWVTELLGDGAGKKLKADGGDANGEVADDEAEGAEEEDENEEEEEEEDSSSSEEEEDEEAAEPTGEGSETTKGIKEQTDR